MKYKVGDRYKAAEPFGGTGKIIAAHGEHYWVLADGDEGPFTPSRAFVDSWEKVEPFFEEGKTYRHKGGGHDTWWIKSVEELDGEKYALAYFCNGPNRDRRPVIIVGRFDEFTVVD